MAHDDERPGGGTTGSQGLAGGPGPAPPGVDDGTPKAGAESLDALPLAAPAGEEAALRGAPEGGGGRSDPEEPDPS